jgi:hypothetical protein
VNPYNRRRDRALVLVAQLAAPPIDPGWFGTWRLNIEKSTYEPGPPPYKRATFTIAPHKTACA